VEPATQIVLREREVVGVLDIRDSSKCLRHMIFHVRRISIIGILGPK
jgi:hypothetical protein